METSTWIGIILASNAVILGAATLATNLMIKSSEKKAEEANKLQNATIKNLETSFGLIEKEVAKLRPLKDVLKQNESTLATTKRDVSRLKAVLLFHGRKQTATLKYIKNQEDTISKLEEKLLTVSSIIRSQAKLSERELTQVRSELSSGMRAVAEVQRIVKRIEKETQKEHLHPPMPM